MIELYGIYCCHNIEIDDERRIVVNSSLRVEHPDAYWSESADAIEALCQFSTSPIDLLLLTGDYATDAQFLVVVE
jgi:hypothetical protein